MVWDESQNSTVAGVRFNEQEAYAYHIKINKNSVFGKIFLKFFNSVTKTVRIRFILDNTLKRTIILSNRLRVVCSLM
jgi:hypothetical protein